MAVSGREWWEPRRRRKMRALPVCREYRIMTRSSLGNPAIHGLPWTGGFAPPPRDGFALVEETLRSLRVEAARLKRLRPHRHRNGGSRDAASGGASHGKPKPMSCCRNGHVWRGEAPIAGPARRIAADLTSAAPTWTIRGPRGAIAQLGERLHGMQEVDGSIPSGSTTTSPSSRGLGHNPFTVATGVRIPVGTPACSNPVILRACTDRARGANNPWLTSARCPTASRASHS